MGSESSDVEGVLGSSDLSESSPLGSQLSGSEDVLSSSSGNERSPLGLGSVNRSSESGGSGGSKGSVFSSGSGRSLRPGGSHDSDLLVVGDLSGITLGSECGAVGLNVMSPLLDDSGGRGSVLLVGSSVSSQPRSVLSSVGVSVGNSKVSNSDSVRSSVLGDVESVGSVSGGSSSLHKSDQSSLSVDVGDSSSSDDSSSNDSS